MRRFILGLVVVLFAAGQAVAVDLQPGDVIAAASPDGEYDGSAPVSLVRIDSNGQKEVISGCVDHACDVSIGSGPSWDLPMFGIRQISVVSLDEIFVTLYVLPDNAADCAGASGYRLCYLLLSVDPATGDRSIVSATGVGFEQNSSRTTFVGSSPGLFEAIDVVPAQLDPDPISAGLPGLTGWGIAILVGFLLGASYMKGKYDGRVAA